MVNDMFDFCNKVFPGFSLWKSTKLYLYCKYQSEFFNIKNINLLSKEDVKEYMQKIIKESMKKKK